MHTVVVTIKVQPGKTQQVLDALAASLPDTRKFAGCQLVETYVDEDDPTTIILWEKWDVRESQGKYMAWRSSIPGDPKLAEALAAAPTFDPNKAGSADANDRGNRALTHVFEPGSTQKLITLSAVVNEGKANPDRKSTRLNSSH